MKHMKPLLSFHYTLLRLLRGFDAIEDQNRYSMALCTGFRQCILCVHLESNLDDY